jgi:hypothetical protein
VHFVQFDRVGVFVVFSVRAASVEQDGTRRLRITSQPAAVAR